MYRPCGPAKNRTAAEISAVVALRPSGTPRSASEPDATPAEAPRTVSTDPGATQLQVIRCGPSSIASARINPSRPAFDADTWQRLGVPICVEMPDSATIAPPPRGII